jgi:hypothetical protein
MTGESTAATIHTDPFGMISQDHIDNVTLDKLHTLKQQIFAASLNAPNGYEPASDNALIQKLEEFRTGVGALWLKLSRELDDDITKAYQTTDSFWRCMWKSLLRREFRPQKYYSICGTPSTSYGCLATFLGNLPAQEKMAKRWGYTSWKQHVDRVWQTKSLSQ